MIPPPRFALLYWLPEPLVLATPLLFAQDCTVVVQANRTLPLVPIGEITSQLRLSQPITLPKGSASGDAGCAIERSPKLPKGPTAYRPGAAGLAYRAVLDQPERIEDPIGPDRPAWPEKRRQQRRTQQRFEAGAIPRLDTHHGIHRETAVLPGQHLGEGPDSPLVPSALIRLHEDVAQIQRHLLERRHANPNRLTLAGADALMPVVEGIGNQRPVLGP